MKTPKTVMQKYHETKTTKVMMQMYHHVVPTNYITKRMNYQNNATKQQTKYATTNDKMQQNHIENTPNTEQKHQKQ